MNLKTDATRHYLVASDFDQTLSFNDSGLVLSELIGATGFEEKVAGLAAAISFSKAASSPISSVTTRSSAASGASTSSKPAAACA